MFTLLSDKARNSVDPSFSMVTTTTSLVTSGPTAVSIPGVGAIGSGEGIVVHPSGDRLYCAFKNGYIAEYTCSTWDVTTVSFVDYADVRTTIGGGNLRDISSENGIDWYMFDNRGGDKAIIYLFRCTVPWNMSNLVTTPISSFTIDVGGTNLGIYVTGKYIYTSNDDGGQKMQLIDISNGLSNAVVVYETLGITDRAAQGINATSDGRHIFAIDLNSSADQIYAYESIFPGGFLNNDGAVTKVYNLNTTQFPDAPVGICFDRKTFTRFMFIEGGRQVNVINLLV